MDDSAHRVTDSYYKFVLERSARKEQSDAWSENRMGSGEAVVSDVDFLGEEMHRRRVYLTNEPLIVRIYYKAKERVENPLIGLSFTHVASGTNMAGPNNQFNDCMIPYMDGEGYLDYRVEHLPFLPGDYLVSTAVYDTTNTHRYDYWHQCARFTVVPGGTQERYGLIALEGKWEHHDSLTGLPSL